MICTHCFIDTNFNSRNTVGRSSWLIGHRSAASPWIRITVPSHFIINKQQKVLEMMLVALFFASLVTSHGYKNGYRLNFRGLFMKSGMHGEEFHYMPVIKGSRDEHYPRILPIAGVYPGITIEEVMAPSAIPLQDPGSWTYSFPDPDEPNLGTIAVPGIH